MHKYMHACMQMFGTSFLSFFQKVRAVVKHWWAILFGSSEKVQEVQDSGKPIQVMICGRQVQVLPEFTKSADPKFPSYNKDCLEVRGKVYRPLPRG